MTRRRPVVLFAVLTAVLTVALAGAGAAQAAAGPGSPPAPRYDHVFVVVEENHGFTDVIGNAAAPNLNALARQYGLATSYYGVTHPSEPNYIALLGGSTFGITSDAPYFVNRVAQPSLISQLDAAHLPWKAYLQGLPHAGYQGICYPAFCNGSPDKDPLYAAKHNPIPNFTTSQNAADWSRQVPAEQLRTDLTNGHVPAFGLIIPDECHDQHGDPPYCVDSGTPGDPQDQRLVATGDAQLGQLVSGITHAPFWGRGNNAVVVTYDEGNDNAGCCAATPGGGRIATVVVTNHGPRQTQDPTPYNHYSLLATVQRSLGLGCLAHTCDTAAVRPMSRLFAPTGAPATPTDALPVPNEPTPTPTPPPGSQPVGVTTTTGSSGGWSIAPAPRIGTGDNSLGAVSAAGPRDIWAVGNYLPSAATSNPDATLTFAAHYDGTRWTSTPTPNTGPNFATLFGVAAMPGQAWAVGTALDAGYHARSLIEHWDGTAWQLQAAPTLPDTRDVLYGVTAAGPADIWAVGLRERSDGRISTLVEHYDGHAWTVTPALDPGAAGNAFYAVAARSAEDVWAVGQRNDASSDTPLVEHFDGSRWTTVPAAGSAAAPSGLLDTVSVQGGQITAAGQTDDSGHAAQPLIATVDGQGSRLQIVQGVGTFTNLNGITTDASGRQWATGTTFDPNGTYDGQPGGVQQTLMLTREGGSWHRVPAPSPGTADRVLGGVVSTGDDVWTVGYFKAPDGREALLEHHSAG